MSQVKGTYHFGIRRQMTLILLILFVAGGCILYGSIHARLQQNLEEQVMKQRE